MFLTCRLKNLIEFPNIACSFTERFGGDTKYAVVIRACAGECAFSVDSEEHCQVVGLNNVMYGRCRPVVTAQLQQYKIIRPYMGKMSCLLQWQKPLWHFSIGQGRSEPCPTFIEEKKKHNQNKE